MVRAKLFDYWRSSTAFRVRIALNLLALPYDTVPVDLVGGEQCGAANLDRNPQGLVPVLEIDGLRLTQSLAIIEYLDETRKGGWLPVDPAERAMVRATAHAIAMEVHPVCNLRVARHAVSLGATMEGWMKHFISLGLEGVEGLLRRDARGIYCHGDHVTLADICLVPQVYNARRWNVDLSAFPRLTAISAALETLPAFQAAHPDHARPAG
ncbi:MAG: maleylacetoacetate isomerase [Rhodobacterales bacterium 32-67-9]|nr:MAG: maleylacetoacetate isomerase [Rhodobacterales bacterium 32-67-9]